MFLHPPIHGEIGRLPATGKRHRIEDLTTRELAERYVARTSDLELKARARCQMDSSTRSFRGCQREQNLERCNRLRPQGGLPPFFARDMRRRYDGSALILR